MARAPFRRLICTAVIIVFIVYLLQTLSPLRLVGDGIDYLLQASSAADGHGFLVHGQRSMRPPGYPFLIFVLIKVGIGQPWAIVALNCLFLGLGAIGAYLLLRESFELGPEASSMICLLTLLSFVIVRQVTQPLSDICFFGASVWCVFLLSQIEKGKAKFWLLAPAALLLIVCVELRTIGVTLIAAFLWALFGGNAGLAKVPSWIRQHRIASIAACLVVTVMLVWASRIIIDSRYFQFNQPNFQRRGVVGSVTANLRDRTLEWGTDH